jgi:hypothetical protein
MYATLLTGVLAQYFWSVIGSVTISVDIMKRMLKDLVQVVYVHIHVSYVTVGQDKFTGVYGYGSLHVYEYLVQLRLQIQRSN